MGLTSRVRCGNKEASWEVSGRDLTLMAARLMEAMERVRNALQKEHAEGSKRFFWPKITGQIVPFLEAGKS